MVKSTHALSYRKVLKLFKLVSKLGTKKRRCNSPIRGEGGRCGKTSSAWMVAAARYPPSTPSHAMLLPRPRRRAVGPVLFRASFPGPDPRAGSAPSSVLLELARRSSSMPIHRPCLRPAAPGLGGSLLHASAARAR
jgi:hypothetical protein